MESKQTGFLLATSVINNGEVTGSPWSNPNDLLLVDGQVAESNPSNGVASDVVIGNFNPDLPSNAIVQGIEIMVIGYAGSPTSPSISISPNFLDNTSGSDVYFDYTAPFTGLTQSLETYTLGNTTYLFGQGSLTVDQVNNLKLSLLASGDVYLDAVLINVFYEVPTTPTPSTPGIGCADCNSPIQAQPFTLALDMGPGETKFTLESFNYPDGTPILYTDLGACGGAIDLIFDPGVASNGNGGNFEENMKVASWATNPDGTVTFDLVSVSNRGLMFRTPYTNSSSLQSGHNAGSEVIIGNSGSFYSRFQRTCALPVDNFNELVGGSTTTFTLTHLPIPGTVRLYADRNRLYPTTDYSVNNTTGVITTVGTYSAGDLLADYQSYQS